MRGHISRDTALVKGISVLLNLVAEKGVPPTSRRHKLLVVYETKLGKSLHVCLTAYILLNCSEFEHGQDWSFSNKDSFVLSRRLVHAINQVNNSWAKHLPATKPSNELAIWRSSTLSHNFDYISPETVISTNVGTKFVTTNRKTILNLQRHLHW